MMGLKPKRASKSSFRSHFQRIAVDATVDVLIIYVAYLAAFMARALTTPLDFGQLTPFILFAVFIQISTLYLFGAYHRIWSKTSGHDLIVLVNAVALAASVLLLSDIVMVPHPLPLSVIVLGGMFSHLGFTAVRYRSRLITGLSWRWQAIWNYRFPKGTTRVLIIGAGDAGQNLALRLKYRSPEHKYRVIGFIDDDVDKQGMYVEGTPVLGTRADIEALAQSENIDLIIFAIHKIAGAEMRDILAHCEATPAMVKVLPDMFGLMASTAHAPQLRDVQAEDYIGRNVVTRGEGVDLTPVMHRRVLVTGAAGSIGSELCRQLVHFDPAQLIVLDNNESGLHDLTIELGALYPHIPLLPVLADITVTEQVRGVFERHQPQIVFHAAAYKHVPMLQSYPNEGIRTNVGGTWQLADLACDYGVERFVLISTDKAVNPSSVMGATKRVCELILHSLAQQKNHSTLFTSVRFGNVLGSRGSVVPTFTRQIENGGPVTVTDPQMTRFFMSIPEAANLVVHAACLTKGDDIFILRMGEVVRIVELAERMIRMRGLRPYIDIPIQFTGVRPGEKMNEELYDASEQPSETAHPHIIQLHNWDNTFSVDRFFTQLELLMAASFANSGDALRGLHDVARNGSRPPTPAPAPIINLPVSELAVVSRNGHR